MNFREKDEFWLKEVIKFVSMLILGSAIYGSLALHFFFSLTIRAIIMMPILFLIYYSIGSQLNKYL